MLVSNDSIHNNKTADKSSYGFRSFQEKKFIIGSIRILSSRYLYNHVYKIYKTTRVEATIWVSEE